MHPPSFHGKLPGQTPTYSCKVGHIALGGNSPVVVQSMTNTETSDVAASLAQCIELFRAGSELVRLTVNTPKAAEAVPKICEQLEKAGIRLPLIGDFHYNGHRLLRDCPDCAAALAKYRINPGNVGFGEKKEAQFADMIELACRYEKPVRIGVNWGSLDQSVLSRIMDENRRLPAPLGNTEIMRRSLIASALESAKKAESLGMPKERIILSCKVSGVQDLIAVYQELAARSPYALHLGLTEAGMGAQGMVASTAALSVLLQQGIGDTLRVSLTPEPGASRTGEVHIAQEILQSLELRAFIPRVIACPGCGRTTSSFFQELAKEVETHIKNRMPEWKNTYDGVENMSLAVMGCVVNGPGESRHANIGISLPGSGEAPAAPVYEDGKKTATLKGENIAAEFIQMIDNYVARKYPQRKHDKAL